MRPGWPAPRPGGGARLGPRGRLCPGGGHGRGLRAADPAQGRQPRPRRAPASSCCRAGAIASRRRVRRWPPTAGARARWSTTMVAVQAPERRARSKPISPAANGRARPAAMPSRAWPRRSSPRSTAPMPTSSGLPLVETLALLAGPGLEAAVTTRVVIEDTGFGVRAAMLVDDRLVEVRDADRDDPAVTGALFVGRVDRRRRQAQRRVPRLWPAAAGAAGGEGRARRRGHRRTPADPSAGAGGAAADRPGRARGGRGQGRPGHQRPEAVRLCARLQPGGPGGRGAAAAGRRQAEALRERAAGLVSRWAVRAAPPCRDAAGRGAAGRGRATAGPMAQAGRHGARLPGRAGCRETESPLERLVRSPGRRRRGAARGRRSWAAHGARAAPGRRRRRCRHGRCVRLDPDEPAFAQTGVDVAAGAGAGPGGAACGAAAGC